VNAILAIPLPLRLAALFLAGAAVGVVVNWGTYRLAWHQRWISPWSAPPDGASRRRWSDRVPIAGWWRLAREGTLHGRGFWIRPMLVEIGTGALFAVLYLAETQWSARLMLPGAAGPPPADFLSLNLPLVEHLRYLSHVLVISLMLMASLIDVDEKTIPDAITVPGTLAGLALACAYPWSLLPADHWLVGGAAAAEFLTLASPDVWPAALGGLPRIAGLATALGCWTLWCGGLLPRRWNTRRGWRTAVRVFVHRLRAETITYRILAMWLLGSGAVVLAASRLREAHWAGLVTALVGLAAGGGLVWGVRVVGTAALRREAMGFGDVTLLSMIGAFLGWQAALVVFFLAPFAALLVGVLQWIAHGEREIPYGPFLCLAALAVILAWPDIWPPVSLYFAMGWLLPAILLGCMGLLGGMLWVYRLALGAYLRRG
jgi:prepilin signal peptidase PulO-like enzyme (type II secretory pathway)